MTRCKACVGWAEARSPTFFGSRLRWVSFVSPTYALGAMDELARKQQNTVVWASEHMTVGHGVVAMTP